MSLCNRSFLLFLVSLFLVVLLPATAVNAKVVDYEFDIDYKTVNFSGKNVIAMAVGGSIPAPTIEATVGDTLRVTFHNKMKVESSIHWHGILLPNDQDGVPYLTTPPIKAGQSFTYEFPVTHHGTYWYHSHTGLQEQRGVYGSIVFHPAAGEKVAADYDQVLVLSDWTDENPNRVMHNLKKSDDYYALKKDSVQSWLKVIQHGSQAIENRIDGAWRRMGPMDISDVGYDAFLMNGQKAVDLVEMNAGDTVRLRIINAAASSYFYLQYAGGPMQIVAVDGVDVEPIKVERQRIAIAETFDVIVKLPGENAFELRATSEDGTGYSSAFIGRGEKVLAPDYQAPNPFLMDHSQHGGMHMEMDKKHAEMDHSSMVHSDMNHSNMNHSNMDHSNMNHAEMDHSAMNHKKTTKNMMEYERLRALQPTRFQADNPVREVQLNLTGDMERYAWSFNNKVLSEDSKILIRKGETVRFVLENKTMMHHPLHLHGHFFRVLNGQGDYAPLKHTVNVPSMQTVTIEFLANEEKDWFFHCHNLYHMKSGMTRVISYESSTTATKNSMAPLFADKHWFYFADVAIANNFSDLELTAENTRNLFQLEYDWDYEDDYEVELSYARYINRFVELYAGASVEQEAEDSEKEKEELGFIGLHYLLPLLIDADLRLDHEGHGRLELASELQLTDRLAFEWRVDTDDAYRLELHYELTKNVVIVGNHDDHFDWGVGVQFRY